MTDTMEWKNSTGGTVVVERDEIEFINNQARAEKYNAHYLEAKLLRAISRRRWLWFARGVFSGSVLVYFAYFISSFIF